jgi:hypothetical protein
MLTMTMSTRMMMLMVVVATAILMLFVVSQFEGLSLSLFPGQRCFAMVPHLP